VDALPYLRQVDLKRTDVPDASQYPFCLPVISNLRSLTFHPAITFLVGENGSGKSTLIEAMAIIMGLNSEGGNRNTQFRTEATHSELWRYLRPIKSFKRPKDWYFLRAENFLQRRVVHG
jgi:predicted ATPase